MFLDRDIEFSNKLHLYDISMQAAIFLGVQYLGQGIFFGLKLSGYSKNY
jgi:hypothetical protein